MDIDSLNNQKISQTVSNASSSLYSSSLSDTAAKSNELGKDAFIKMLVEQLKNQDPTEPIKNEDLAVNLAQFSQVEKLTEISGKLGTGGLSDSASLAAFLGKEVSVGGSQVDIAGGNGGSVYFEIPFAATNATIELIDSSGSVVASHDTGELSAGRQTVSLNGVDVADGKYTVNVSAKSSSGEEFLPAVSAGGVVTGFIPGADPTLLVGDKEIKLADIQMVSAVNY